MSKPKLGDWLYSINQSKKNMMVQDPTLESSYPSWIVNKCLSSFTDTVLFANEMNMNWHISKRMQYDFFINSLRPRKRFSPWSKKESIDYLEDVQEYYGYSYTKALEVIRILPKSDLEQIRKLLHKGGT
tara:strand:- start:401 stop:787 length:387 start_codon:yes stop_codon:yes gene_type:complete